MLSILYALTALFSLATAKKCMNATVPVTISSRNGLFGNVAVPQNNLEVTTFVQNMTQQGRNFSEIALTGYNTTAGTYNISAEFCRPDSSNSTSPTLQILTHGIGFDKTYWDPNFNNFNYSYVDVATAAGYFTLAYDRLGLGNSSKGNPVDEIQSFLEVQALRSLTMQMRNGTYPGVNTTFGKVIHVGHSFGSLQTYSLVNSYPNISDGIVLTGFTTNSSFNGIFLAGGGFQMANLNAPIRFGNTTGKDVQNMINQSPIADYVSGIDFSTLPSGQDLPDGYMVTGDAAGNQLQFFYPGNFDPAILQFADETKQPVTLGELLTLGAIPKMNAFTGPVMVINGANDVPFCGGDCLATGNPDLASLGAAVSTSFPMVSSSDFLSYNQPMTGHGINFHYNATAAFQVIQDFLGSKNLASR